MIDVETAHYIAGVWLDAGGARNRLVASVAVALAASGGDPAFQSDDGHYGLWGITDKVARKLGAPFHDLLDPGAATGLAILLSGNGTNWGIWSQVWAPGSTPSRRQQVLWPQPGSPAWQQMPVAQVAVGNWDGVDYSDTFGDALNDFGYAWNTLSWVLTTWMAGAYSSISDTSYLAEGLQRT